MKGIRFSYMKEQNNALSHPIYADSLKINPELYRIFYHVAQEGSISRAAEKFFITQPAVSRSILQLEEKTGCTLFFRTPRGVHLTKEGEVLYKYVEQAIGFLQLGEKMLSQLKNLESGGLSIGVGDSICKHYLLPFLKMYNREYPGIRFHITNQKTYEIIDQLKSGRIDLGIINLPVEDDQLRITRVMEINDCFIVGDKYKFLAEQPRTLAELAEYPLMLIEKGSNSRQYIENFLLMNGLNPEPDFELGNFELLAEFASINLGIACVIREFFHEEMQRNEVYEIPLLETIPARGIAVVSLKVVPLSAPARKMIKLLTSQNAFA
jgi:LysR family transcriptional regulator, cyn operon transcriptional activator